MAQNSIMYASPFVNFVIGSPLIQGPTSQLRMVSSAINGNELNIKIVVIMTIIKCLLICFIFLWNIILI